MKKLHLFEAGLFDAYVVLTDGQRQNLEESVSICNRTSRNLGRRIRYDDLRSWHTGTAGIGYVSDDPACGVLRSQRGTQNPQHQNGSEERGHSSAIGIAQMASPFAHCMLAKSQNILTSAFGIAVE